MITAFNPDISYGFYCGSAMFDSRGKRRKGSGMEKEFLSITCPLCGRKYDKHVKELYAGAEMACPLCGVKLKLHGHMWKDIQNEIGALVLKSD